LLEKTDQFAAFASSSAIMDATSAARRVQQLTRHVAAATTVAPVVGTSAPLSLDLSGQVALVTGGVRGIGRAISERLALNGASLVICDIDEAEVAAAAAELASAHQTQVLGLRCNVASTDDVVAMIETIDARFGRLDIVCNNAGINVGATPEKGRLPVDQFRRSDWDNIIAVDLTGSFDVAQRSIPLLRKAGGGRIVNIASVAAVHPLRLQVGFGAAKAGVVNMTQCMALVSTTACTRLCMRAYVHGQTKL
jgi:3-oxoacyl-[acyl-carrier protein] reductase